MRILVFLVVFSLFLVLPNLSFSGDTDVWGQCSTSYPTCDVLTNNYDAGCSVDADGTNYCCSTTSGDAWQSAACGCNFRSSPSTISLTSGEHFANLIEGVNTLDGGFFTFYETPHGYSDNMFCGVSTLYTCPSESKIRFNIRLDTENWDKLIIKNAAGVTYATISGGTDTYRWTQTYNQNTAKFTFTSDVSISSDSGYWGVDVQSIDCVLESIEFTSTISSDYVPLDFGWDTFVNNLNINVISSPITPLWIDGKWIGDEPEELTVIPATNGPAIETGSILNIPIRISNSPNTAVGVYTYELKVSASTSEGWSQTIMGSHWSYPIGFLTEGKIILNANKFFTDPINNKVEPIIFYASDYPVDSTTTNFIQSMLDEIQSYYGDQLGQTFDMLPTQVITGDNSHEWYFCENNEPGCLTSDFFNNIRNELSDNGINTNDPNRVVWVVILGGGGVAGGIHNFNGGGWSLSGDASVYPALDNNCNRLQDYYYSPSEPDNIKTTCINTWIPNNFLQTITRGTLAHELGHTFDLPHPDGHGYQAISETHLITIEVKPTFSFFAFATPISGKAPLSSSIHFLSSGDATGTISYVLNCDNGFIHTDTITNPSTFDTIPVDCVYTTPGGQYQPTLELTRDGITVGPQIVDTINVDACSIDTTTAPTCTWSTSNCRYTVEANYQWTGLSQDGDHAHGEIDGIAGAPIDASFSTFKRLQPISEADGLGVHTIDGFVHELPDPTSGAIICSMSQQTVTCGPPGACTPPPPPPPVSPTISTLSSSPNPPIVGDTSILSGTVTPGDSLVTGCNLFVVGTGNVGSMAMSPSPCISGSCTLSKTYAFPDSSPKFVRTDCTDSAGSNTGPTTSFTAIYPTPTPAPIDSGCSDSNQCGTGCCLVGTCDEALTCHDSASPPLGCSCDTPGPIPIPGPGSAPTVTLNSYSPDPTNDNTPRFTGTATDSNGDDIISITYRVRQGATVIIGNNVDAFTSSSSVGFSFTTPILSEGTYTIDARATDATGKLGSFSSADTLTIDLSPVTSSIVSVEGDTTSPYFDTTNDGNTDIYVLGETGMNCRWYTSDIGYTTSSGIVCGIVENQALCIIPTGESSYTRHISCIDSVGNIQSNSQNVDVNWLVDYSGSTFNSLTHSPQYPTTSDSVAITADVSESNLDTIQIFVDSTLRTTCTSSPCTLPGSTYTWGSHTYYAIATDDVGLITREPSSGTYTFNSNDNPSVRSINDETSSGLCLAGETVTLRCTVSDPNENPEDLQAVYVWAGECDVASGCFDTRSWIETGRVYKTGFTDSDPLNHDTMTYDSGTGTYTTTFVIDADTPVGTNIAATCQPLDNFARDDWKNHYNDQGIWGDGYPICTVGGCTDNPQFEFLNSNPNPAKAGEVIITFESTLTLPLDPIVTITPNGGASVDLTTADSSTILSGGRVSYRYKYTVNPSDGNGVAAVLISGTTSQGCIGQQPGSLTIDTIPPTVEFDNTIPTDTWQQNAFTITQGKINCNDATSGCDLSTLRIRKQTDGGSCLVHNFDNDFSDIESAPGITSPESEVSGNDWICIAVRDNAGNVNINVTPIEYKIDGDPPIVTLNDPPEEIGEATVFTFATTASDSESGVVFHEIIWNYNSLKNDGTDNIEDCSSNLASCSLSAPTPLGGGQTIVYAVNVRDDSGRETSIENQFTVCGLNSITVEGDDCKNGVCSGSDNLTITNVNSIGSCPVSSLIQIDAISDDELCNLTFTPNPEKSNDFQGIFTPCTGSSCGKWQLPTIDGKIPLGCRQKVIKPSASSIWKTAIGDTGERFAGTESVIGEIAFGGDVNLNVPLPTFDKNEVNVGEIIEVTFNPIIVAPEDPSDTIQCEEGVCTVEYIKVDGINCLGKESCQGRWEGNSYIVEIDTSVHHSDVEGGFGYGNGTGGSSGEEGYEVNFPPAVTGVTNDPDIATIGQPVIIRASIVDIEGDPIINVSVCNNSDCISAGSNKVFCDNTTFVHLGGGIFECVYTAKAGDGLYYIYAEDEKNAINNSERGTFIATDKEIIISPIVFSDLETKTIGEFQGKPVYPTNMTVVVDSLVEVDGILCDDTICKAEYSINGTFIGPLLYDNFTDTWFSDYNYRIRDFDGEVATNHTFEIIAEIITTEEINGEILTGLKRTANVKFKVKYETTLTLRPHEARLVLGQNELNIFELGIWDSQERDFDLYMSHSISQGILQNWVEFGCPNVGNCTSGSESGASNEIDRIKIASGNKAFVYLGSTGASKSGAYPITFTVESTTGDSLSITEIGFLLVFAEGLNEFSNIQLLIAFMLSILIFSTVRYKVYK